MPYGSNKAQVERLHLPSDPAYWVDMKTKATRGDRLAAQEAMFKVKNVKLRNLTPEEMEQVETDPEDPTAQRGMLTQYRTKAYFDMWMVRLIVEWNLDDEAGNILPITAEVLDGLEAEDDEFLQEAAKKRMKKKTVDPPSEGRSPVSSQDTPSPTPELARH